MKRKRGRPPGSKNKPKLDTMRPSRPGRRRGRGWGRGRGRGAGTSNFMDISVEDTVYHEMNGVNELDEVVERVQRERMNLLQEGPGDSSLETFEVMESIPVVPQPTGVLPNMYPSYTPLTISPPHQVPVVPQPTGILPAIYPRRGDY